MPDQRTLIFRIGMQGVFSKVISNNVCSSSSNSNSCPVKDDGQCLYEVNKSDFHQNENCLKEAHIQSSLDNSSWNENNLEILVDGLTIKNSELSRIKAMLPKENVLQQNCCIKLLSSHIDTKENCVSLSLCDQVHQNSFYEQIKLNNQGFKCANCDHFCAKHKWQYKTKEKLEKLCNEDLKVIIQELSHTVKEVSEELVPLLQEKDSLQDEIDARNIVIEQLLKLTWRHTQLEPRPIQMSVILPTNEENVKDHL